MNYARINSQTSSKRQLPARAQCSLPPSPCNSYFCLPIQSSLCLGTHIATHSHTHTQRGPPLVGWQHAASELPSNTATATENDLNTEKCVQFFALGYFWAVQGGIPFDETCKQSLGRGGAKVKGTICKQLLSSLKAKFSSFIYFRFLIIISSSFFSVAALHFVSCLCVCNIFVCLHLLRILMNLLLICVRYICRLHWPHGVLVLLPAPVHDSARSSAFAARLFCC